MKRILCTILAVCMIACLFGCNRLPVETPAPTGGNNPTNAPTAGPTLPTPQLEYAAGTELRMATGYQKINEGLFFDADTVGEGITLADGKTYHTGDLKPTWAEMQNRLNVKFIDKWQGSGSAEKEYKFWQDRLDEVDMIAGSASILNESGVAGNLINIAEYLDMMPNFKAYLEANPIIRLSITGDTSNGALYFSPYFDGVNDIERMPLMRTDWVEKLLNGAGEFAADASHKLNAAVYTPYMPVSGSIKIDVVKADGSGVEQVTKDYDKGGNIVKIMNDALAAGEVTGVQAVNMLRKYIDEAYGGYYGEKRADLFIGQNAAWDADELVALLRCVVANPQTLNGTDNVEGLFSREDDNNQRRVDMFRFCGTLFGVRGLESRQDYLYVGTDGKLHDARQEEATYIALERMNALVDEGLISQSFVEQSKEKTETMLANDLGFMHYDYNQTQTIYNETKLDKDAGEKYRAVMVPVAHWFDGTEGGVYMRFTESWRSVKTDGWAISKAGVGDDLNKLYAALKLIDYAYTYEGQVLLSYGPNDFIKMDGDKFVTFDFNGEQMPVISDASFESLWSIPGLNGNYTNYGRRYLGSTYSFMKLQSFEYQCTTAAGKEGAGYISKAIALGIIHHPELAITENPWYTIVPTILPTTKEENDLIGSYTDLTSNGKFSSSKGGSNILISLIVGNCEEVGFDSAAAAASTVSGTMSGSLYLELKQDAYNRLIAYYDTLTK